MTATRILFVLLAVAVLAVTSQAQLPTKQVLTLDTAKKIAAAAEAEAKKRGATVVIAVVDDGGYLLVLERLDDTQVAVGGIAQHFQRRLVALAVMGGGGALDAVELDDDHGLGEHGLVRLCRRGAGQKFGGRK